MGGCGRADFSVHTGSDGTDVVERVVKQQEKFDALLLDERLKVMNGSEACLCVREYEVAEQLPEMPIIAISANVEPDDLVRLFWTPFQLHGVRVYRWGIMGFRGYFWGFPFPCYVFILKKIKNLCLCFHFYYLQNCNYQSLSVLYREIVCCQHILGGPEWLLGIER